MIKAEYSDKDLVIDILTSSFDTNKSVNYIVSQDKYRRDRIKTLMSYSFDLCYLFGEIFLSDDKKACALILFPDKKKTTLKTVFLDVKLILFSISLRNVKKVLSRDSMIKGSYPDELMYYIWFIGVNTNYQKTGIGSSLLNELISDSILKKRRIYLETSMQENVPWYKKNNMEVYKTLPLTHNLYMLRMKEINTSDILV